MTDFPHDHNPNDEERPIDEIPNDGTLNEGHPIDDAIPTDETLYEKAPSDDAIPTDDTLNEEHPIDDAIPTDETLYEKAPSDDAIPTDETPNEGAPIDDPANMSEAPETRDAETVNSGPGDPSSDAAWPTDPEADPEADPATDPDTARSGSAQDSLGGGYDPGSNIPPPPFTAGPSTGVGPVRPMRRLYRSRHDRRLGGVSAGIAEFFGIDPTIVRLATLVFAVTGVGILVYLVAWLIVPLRPEGLVVGPRPRPMADERTTNIALGVAALALAFGIITGSWVLLALALVGGGVWLLSHPTPVAAASPSAMAPTQQYAYAPPQPPADAGHYAATGGFPPPRDNDGELPPGRERVPQRITWTVLSLLALLTAVGMAAATGDWWDVSATRFLGGAVVIIAIGVVVGQIRGGGARGLIPLGLLAALALIPVSAVDGLLDDGVGDTTYRPTSLVELESQYEHGIGQMTVDLSQLDFDGLSETIDIDLGIGKLVVIVSPDTGGRALLNAKAGEISHQLSRRGSFLVEDGVNVDSGTVVLDGEDGEVDLNISVGVGTAELRSAAG